MLNDRKRNNDTAKPFSDEVKDQQPPKVDHPHATPDRDQASEDDKIEKTTQRMEYLLSPVDIDKQLGA